MSAMVYRKQSFFAVGPLLAAALALCGVASAASARTLSLTPDEKARVLAQNTESSVDAARAGYVRSDISGAGARRGIHGEIGAMIGSNGTRGAYGIAAIPLGDSASATVAFDSERYGYGRRR